jgi:hemerythrin
MYAKLPPQIETGIASIDDQHRALIHWARAMDSLPAENGNRPLVMRAAQFLIAYTRFHFDSEEYAMVASGYGGIAQHRREHAMMRKELSALNRRIKENDGGDTGSVSGLQSLVRNWIQNHISASDRSFARYCEEEPSARSVQLPSPREMWQSGLKVSDYEQVEVVHAAGEITIGELKARLKIR